MILPPHKSTPVAVPPLGVDLAIDAGKVEVEEATDATIPATTVEACTSLSKSTSNAASSSQATSPSRGVLIPMSHVSQVTDSGGYTIAAFETMDVEDVLKPTPEVEADDVVLSAVFGDEIPIPDPSHAAGKQTRSFEHNIDVDETRWTKKRVAAVRGSITTISFQIGVAGAHEMGVGPSGSRGTTDCFSTTIEDVTKSVTRVDPAGYEKLDPSKS
uniref:Integrase core domain containing protein n=1 Tax=Solanum tuberosum TaxID=4113 RepID=M1DE96_SOLTU